MGQLETHRSQLTLGHSSDSRNHNVGVLDLTSLPLLRVRIVHIVRPCIGPLWLLG